MGIPFYFSRITKEHPEIVKSNLGTAINFLFLDFNCGIHYCNKVLRDELKGSDIDDEEYERLLIEKCLNYVDEIIEGIVVENLFISIDGVVPFAKMSQQRKRRYLSVFRKEKLPSSVHDWDSNAISPGTAFMTKLNDRLKEATFNVSNTIISDSTEPGEGETKIFNFIERQQLTTQSIVIYGLDADLIMLSMLVERDNKLFLMRESEFYRYGMDSKFLFLNIDLLKGKLIDHIHAITDVNCFKNPIHNYVVVCMLIGNDFIPSLSYLKIANNSIDLLLQTLGKCTSDEGTGELIYFDDQNSKSWKLNWITFKYLLSDLSTSEDSEFLKIHSRYYNHNKQCKDESDKIDHFGICFKPPDTIFPHKDGWRRRYYSALFQSATLDDICKNYVIGLTWNVEYYLNHRCFTKWHFPYDYSPTIFDLNNYITVTNADGLQMPSDEEYVSAEEHLARILPKQSHHLLNQSLKDRLSKLKYAKLYPVKYEIQTYLKHYLHDCVPLIPGMTDIKSI
tara:strand:- start:2702 stop:4222 length:1521 start_codon:yes stop_codon:yes gene_type:complete